MLPPDLIFLKLKCAKFDFGWGSASDPAGGAHSAPQIAYLDFMGSYTSKGRREKGEGRGKREKAGSEGTEEERKGKEDGAPN